ncbi:MAG: cobalt transporter CbiM [Chitinispirillaceae bacterium]|jgi:cobalt/nickel transport system permease protein
MHIPDGYLGPITCAAGFAVMVPVWAVASGKVKKTLNARQVPLLAIASAFCFVIMMFNVPIPGGTTGHAVGGALAAILLGPWAACIAVSVALVIQALLFGDGGITAIGANCFNMAFVLPFAGYAAYKLISGRSSSVSLKRAAAAGFAGYIGLNLSALTTAIMFGIQPYLHHTTSGQPLYCPYGLKIAVPMMLGGHLLLFGWIELIVTALVVRFLQKQEPVLLQVTGGKTPAKLWLGLAVLALLSPLGIFLPAKLAAGTAWGEWGIGEIKILTGYLPQGMEKLSSLWNAPLPGYAFKGSGQNSTVYIISALIGIALCLLAAYSIGKFLADKNGFIERTLRGTVSLLSETVASDTIASRNGFLQKCDPRLKIVSILALLVAVLFSRSIILVVILYGVCLALAALSSAGLGYFLKRTLLFIPLFALVISLPAVFSPITPGEPIAAFTLLSRHFAITRQGVDTALLFFIRVLTSVSFAVLLVITTKHHVLLKTLRIFKIPRIFIMTMGMSYRYIYLLLDLIQNSFTAIKSRAGFVTLPKTGRRIVALNMAGLWLRSYRMHGQVYDAMVSRGYAGEPAVLDEFRARKGDYLFLFTSFFILIGTLWLNRFFH